MLKAKIKAKTKLTQEELNKVELETYYENQMKEFHKKTFNDLPEDVHNYILTFLDTNTRLNLLRTKYPTQFILHP
jgi:hypothetical protein